MRPIIPVVGICMGLILSGCEPRMDGNYSHGIVKLTLNDTIIHFGGETTGEFYSVVSFSNNENKNLGHLEMDFAQFDTTYEYRGTLNTYCKYHYNIHQVYESEFTGVAWFNVYHPYMAGTYELKKYAIYFDYFESNRMKGTFQGMGMKMQDSSYTIMRCDFDFFP